MSEIIEIFK